MGELLPARSVQGRVQRGRPPRVGPADALDTPQVRGQAPARDARDETSLLRQRLAVRPREGRVHRRLQRHRDALPLPLKQLREPLDPETSSRRQRRLTGGKDTRSARCPERGTPGAGGGLRETDGGNTEPRPQAYLTLHRERPIPVVSALSKTRILPISRMRKRRP